MRKSRLHEITDFDPGVYDVDSPTMDRLCYVHLPMIDKIRLQEYRPIKYIIWSCRVGKSEALPTNRLFI